MIQKGKAHEELQDDMARFTGLADFARCLIPWYKKNKRDLPWRRSKDAYRIWISEIMCQQTRVQTVIPYYENFLQKFPDLEDLAAASEEYVVENWAGLGYYSRGKNLRKAAQFLVQEHDSQFPQDLDGLLQLPGVGHYTASAISSIAFGKANAVVDGNVERVLSRYFALDWEIGSPRIKKQMQLLAQSCMQARSKRQSPSDFNQGVMELGALICAPKKPLCEECPLSTNCEANSKQTQLSYPIKKSKRPIEKQSWIAVMSYRDKYCYSLPTPDSSELLAGHWGFPIQQLNEEQMQKDPLRLAQSLYRKHYQQAAKNALPLGAIKHSITYRSMSFEIFAFESLKALRASKQLKKISIQDKAALPALFSKMADRLKSKLSKP